jgi:hypothetical protein
MTAKESNMKQTLRDERGMALALAVVALVVVGALVAGAFFSGTQEQRAAENSRRILQAFGVAEEGAYEVVDQWKPLKNDTLSAYPANSLSVGGWPSSWATAANKTGVYGGFLYHFNNELYLVDMTGRDSVSVGNAGLVTQGGGGRARLGLIVRDRPLQMGIKGALTTGNGDKVSGNTTINGVDQTPTGWGACGPTKAPIAGIRASTGSSVVTNGGATVIGNPPVLIDSTLKDTNFTHYGSVSYAQLAAMATITLPGQNFSTGILPTLTGGGACDQTVLTNWGDPLNPAAPCGGYFPIIHITGSATINGQEGQGILLVDGDLSVQGGFQFYGITIIQGQLKTAGGGGSPAHFWGATIVHDSVSLGTNTVSGSANLLYSSCAVQKALQMTALATLMRSRSWVPLF